jgi:hypothetical protein
MRLAFTLQKALALLLLLTLTALSITRSSATSRFSSEGADSRTAWEGPFTLGAFVHRLVDNRAVCVEAGVDQAHKLRDRDPHLPLSVLVPASDPAGTRPAGLKIVLRGTSQLQSVPAAVDAFKRAAGQWEARIQTDITIIVDVDFGPTLFGSPFEGDVVTSTDAQVLGGNAFYPAVRSGLISNAFDPSKSSFYGSLPGKTVPTDRGATGGMTAPSAALRALSVIDPIADADKELNRFGPPPSIGVNSKFNFDFDASDGIEPGKLDFEALVLHELGHVLGFASLAGSSDGDSKIEPTVWDLFRVRPDGGGDFTTAPRVLEAGGQHSFFDGATRLSLSTGRADGTGGDGRQGAHWKDHSLTGQYLGIMDPTLAIGEHQFMTDNDVDVLDTIGYLTKSLSDPTTVISLSNGRPQAGGMVAPPPNLGVLSHTQYSIAVPDNATQLKIDLQGNQDVDLFVRIGQPVVLAGHNPESDYVSRTPSNAESITITPASTPPLRATRYYIAVANWGPGDADFTVTATVTGGASSSAPAIFGVDAHLEGDALNINYSAVDRDGDFAQAQATIIDATGASLRQTSFTIDSGSSDWIESQISLAGMAASPTAVAATIVLIDRAGNRSAQAVADFSRVETGALNVSGGSFNGSKVTLKVSGQLTNLEVEINGLIISPPQKTKVNASGNKLTIKGDAQQLGLRQGANRIRVRNSSGWSNIFVLVM